MRGQLSSNLPLRIGKGRYMVHQYVLNGFHIVVDTCSGAVHVVDEVAYDINALFENGT